MHRAVLLATGAEIDLNAIRLPDGSRIDAGHEAPAAGDAGGHGPAGSGPALVGRTVADVERSLILDTLNHTLGNRTH
ncbi:hypothetical protein ACE4Z5_27575, partial [Salmonella enterica]